MKRLVLMALALAMVFTCSAEASPAYGTKMPAKGRAFWGLQDYYVRSRTLDNDQGSVRSIQNFLTLSYGVTDWLSLDLKGSLYSYFRHDPQTGNRMEYNNPVWGGGYGFRVKAYESGPVKAVVGFQHFSIHPKTVKANGEKNNGILEDWQGSALVSYQTEYFTPYVGPRYTMMDYIHTRNNERKMIKSDEDRRLGLVTGVDVPLTGRVWINLESDWQDGGSFTTGIYCRF
ncbi:MAG: hypothetical protein HQL22_07575 [Candidatus Omnitrophica bacterium]|nr:hypothetical protein [Candidatus Omnitrophota bacterium]